MAMVLTYGAKVPVVKVGPHGRPVRQAALAPTETVGGVELPSYRGDIINELDFTPEARMPDPEKMLQAYTQAAATLNLLRAFSTGGFADMHRCTPGRWASPRARRRSATARWRADHRHAGFHEGRRRRPRQAHDPATVDFYTSHEALLLEYEEALCRLDSTSGNWLAGRAT